MITAWFLSISSTEEILLSISTYITLLSLTFLIKWNSLEDPTAKKSFP